MNYHAPPPLMRRGFFVGGIGIMAKWVLQILWLQNKLQHALR
jgi:hypothetical protein